MVKPRIAMILEATSENGEDATAVGDQTELVHAVLEPIKQGTQIQRAHLT